jgi:hypothetical protein
VGEVPVEPEGDLGAGKLCSDLDLAAGQLGVPVGIDAAGDLDHRAGGQRGAGGGGHRGRRPGRGRAAHPQLG